MKKYLFFIPVFLISLAATTATANINAQDSIVFDLSNIIYNNDYASVPVYILSDDTVFSLDFSTKFDESGLTYDSTFNLAGYLSALAFFNTSDRTYRFTSSSLQRIENNKTLVLVRFIMLSGKSSIHASDLNTVKGYLNGDPCSIKIIEGFTTSLNTLNNPDAGFTLYPNPANDAFNLSITENATVLLTDMNGKQVMEPINVIAGQNEMINASGLAPGVYTMKVYNDKFVMTRQVIINK